MNVDEQRLTYISNLVEAMSSSDAARVKAASVELENAAKQVGYIQILLKLMGTHMNSPIGQFYAVYFKSHVMKYWVPDEGEEDIISIDDRNAVRHYLIDILVASPTVVKAQLSQALGIISHADFPDKWNNLLDTLMSKISDDFNVTIPVLEAIHSMFYFYRTSSANDQLWTEIKYVHETFFPKLLSTFQISYNMLKTACTSKDQFAIAKSAECLMYCVEIFHSLSYQDLPQFVEDNPDVWFKTLHDALLIDTHVLQHSKSDEPSAMDKLHSVIVETVTMFFGKFEDETKAYAKIFLEAIWKITTSKTVEQRYDDLISECVSNITTLCRKVWFKDFFSLDVLTAIVNTIAVPFMALREQEEENYNMDPHGYISKEIDGDTGSRRGIVTGLISSLLMHHEAAVTPLIQQQITTLITGSTLQREQAVRLTIALGVKAQTREEGATILNPLVDVGSFFSSFVLPELQNINLTGDADVSILKSSCVKFMIVFRSQLPDAFLPDAVKLFSSYLVADDYVLHTITAIAIDALLSLTKPGENKTKVAKINIDIVDYNSLLPKLFHLLSANPDSAENTYVMQCILRLLIITETRILPLANTLMTEILSRLSISAQKQTSAKYTHLLFEVICIMIKTLCKSGGEAAVTQFETLLIPFFQEMLSSDISTDVQPYIFQTLGLLIEHASSLSATLLALFPSLLNASLYSTPANCFALSRLLSAYVVRGIGSSLTPQQITNMLGIYQKLNSISKYDQFSLSIIIAMIYHMAPVMQQYLVSIFKLQFQRLTSKKTDTYLSQLTIFWGICAMKYGGDNVIKTMDSIQNGISNMALTKVWQPTLLTMTGVQDKKIAFLGVIALLKSFLISQPTNSIVPGLVSACIGIAKTCDTNLSVLTATVDIASHSNDALYGSGSLMKLATAENLGFDYANGFNVKTNLAELNQATNGALGNCVANCSSDVITAYATFQ